MKSLTPAEEVRRLEVLRAYQILDTPPEAEFDDITRLAASLFGVPIALISLLDERRQWFKSKLGIDLTETPREHAFCTQAEVGDAFLIVPDAAADPRFASNPFVVGAPGVRFYAGTPLVTSSGEMLGTLCVVDRRPRTDVADRRELLEALGRQVMTRLELRRRVLELERAEALLSRRARQHEAVAALGRAALTSKTLSEVLPTACGLVAEGLGAALCGIHESDASGAGLRLIAGVGWHAGISGMVAAPGTPAAQALVSDAPVVIEDFRFEPRFPAPPVLAAHGMVSGLAVSIRLKDRPWGVLEAYASEPRRHSADDLHFMGSVANLLAVLIERLSTLEALAASDRRMREAQRIAHLGNWEIDLGSGSLTWSDEVFRIFELDPARFGANYAAFLDRVHPEDRDRLRRAREATLRGDGPLDEEHRVVLGNGGIRWVRERGEVIRDAEGRPQGIAGTVLDITSFRAMEASLAASEQRFRQLAESLPLMVWSATAEGEVTYANHRFHEYIESAEGELPGDALVRSLHEEDRERCRRAWAASIASGMPYDIEHRVRRASDGLHRWFRVQANPIRDGEGRILKWYGTGLDIDHLKKLEESAVRLASTLATTLESITDAFITLDRDWRFTYLNAEAERLLRRERSQLLGRPVWDEFPEAVGTTFQREYRRALEENRTVAFEEYYAPLEAWFEVRAYPSEQGLAVYFRDITEAREAKEKLRDQATLLDKAQDAILVRDLRGRILYWNRSAERVYGWTAEEALGPAGAGILAAADDAHLAALNETLAKGEWVGELEQTARDGRRLTIESRWTLVRDEEGRPRSVLAINTDVTERKGLEQQFLRAQRMESIGTLAGGIAHDLNNVLSPILMSIDLLKVDMPHADRLEILSIIESSARNGAEMVSQVLSFARGVAGRRMEVQIRHLVRDLTKIVRETFSRDIRVETSLATDLWSVSGDPTQLHQVLLNLAINARDAMPRGGMLTFSARNEVLDERAMGADRSPRPGPHVIVEVEDTGTGIPREVLDKIFDPFFTTKEPGRGTGLGLSTSLAIVRSHGGFIRVESESGRGSRFRVHLPASPKGSAVESSLSADLPRGRGEWILVVDDEASVRQITRHTLETFGYRVLLAADGAEAVDVYAPHRDEVAVVLIDMMMPVMDGPATIHLLRQLNPAVRIVAVSGLNAENRITRVADFGVRHFLPKPLTAETLLTTLRSVLLDHEVTG